MKNKRRTRISRKEIAYLIDETPDVVRSREKSWGLDKIKVIVSRNNISYWEKEAMEILRALRLVK